MSNFLVEYMISLVEYVIFLVEYVISQGVTELIFVKELTMWAPGVAPAALLSCSDSKSRNALGPNPEMSIHKSLLNSRNNK